MSADYAEIDVQSASRSLHRYRVFDVREPEEFEGPLGHLACAELLPMGHFMERAEELADRPLLLVCRSGNRSGQLCGALVARGIHDVTNLVGGMIAWRQAGLPVVGGDEAC